MSGKSGSANVRRRRLGTELRKYREAAGFTIDNVAQRLEFSPSKISRLENGRIGASPADVFNMLTMYGIVGPDADELMQDARGSRQRGWWHGYKPIMTSDYVAHETAARVICSYESQCVPGLLQTQEYTDNLIRTGTTLSDEGISRRLAFRLQRQAILTRPEPVVLRCVIDEAALRRPVGSWDVMRRQCEHLLSMTRLPNVIWQVLTFEAGAHAGLDGSFVLLRFGETKIPDSVYVMFATGGVLLDKVADFERHELIFSGLAQAALTPAESAGFVARLIEEHV